MSVFYMLQYLSCYGKVSEVKFIRGIHQILPLYIGDHHLRSFVQRQITHSYNSNHQRQSSSLLLEACCNVLNCLQDAQVVHDTYRNEPLLGKSPTISFFLLVFCALIAAWLLEITIQFARPLRKDMPSFASSTSSDTLVPDPVPEERFAVSSLSLNILA